MLKLFQNSKKNACNAVIVAAGRAVRMQGNDKIMSVLCGKTVLQYSIEALSRSEEIQEIVIVTRKDLIDPIRQLCRENQYKKVRNVVEGGDTRTHSVMIGMDNIFRKKGLVAVHDGARPLVSQRIIRDTIQKAGIYHAAAPAVSVTDTVKYAENHIVTKTLDRSVLFAVQTPQIFDFDLLRGALGKCLKEGLIITDDCSAVEAVGMRVYLTEGEKTNIKITTPVDLVLAEAILKGCDMREDWTRV